MLIGITGASGFIGRHVVAAAVRRGHEVIAFSRNATRPLRDCTEVREYNIGQAPNLEGCEAVVHLAGESVIGFWSAAKKRRIVDSRVEGTRRIGEAIRKMAKPPEVLVGASAIGFYGDSGEQELSEDSPPGRGFLAKTCTMWEGAAREVSDICRVANVRIGVVLGKEGERCV